MASMPDGIHTTNQGTLMAVRNGTAIAEAYGAGDFSIYDWSPEHSGLMDQFMARLRELDPSVDDPA